MAPFSYARRAIIWRHNMVPFNGAILLHVCTRHKVSKVWKNSDIHKKQPIYICYLQLLLNFFTHIIKQKFTVSYFVVIQIPVAKCF